MKGSSHNSCDILHVIGSGLYNFLDPCPTIVLPVSHSLTHCPFNFCKSYQTKHSKRVKLLSAWVRFAIGNVCAITHTILKYSIVSIRIFFSIVFSPFSAAGPIQAISSIALSLFWLKQCMRDEYQSKVMLDCETKIPNTRTKNAIKPNTKYQEQSEN